MDFVTIMFLIVSCIIAFIIVAQMQTIKKEKTFSEYLKRELESERLKFRKATGSSLDYTRTIESQKKEIQKLEKNLAFAKTQIIKLDNTLKNTTVRLEDAKAERDSYKAKLIAKDMEEQSEILVEDLTKKELKEFLRIKNELDYDRFTKLLRELNYLEYEGRGMHTRYTLWKRK